MCIFLLFVVILELASTMADTLQRGVYITHITLSEIIFCTEMLWKWYLYKLINMHLLLYRHLYFLYNVTYILIEGNYCNIVPCLASNNISSCTLTLDIHVYVFCLFSSLAGFCKYARYIFFYFVLSKITLWYEHLNNIVECLSNFNFKFYQNKNASKKH